MSWQTFIEEREEGDIRLRFSRSDARGWATADLLALVDSALGFVAGETAEPSHLNVTWLRPTQEADVVALARVIRRDGPRVHAEAWLFSHAVVEPMLHATASFAVPE